jgi:hypothetical protein
MIETIAGGLLGGLFRLAPEILKWLDSKDERKHELAMQDKLIQVEQVRGAQKIEEIGAQGQENFNLEAVKALGAAIQSQDAPSGVKWIDGFNKLIRPLMAFQWVILLYPAVLIAAFVIAVQAGTSPLDALTKVFGPEEKAFTSAIANFYIMNRVFANVK